MVSTQLPTSTQLWKAQKLMICRDISFGLMLMILLHFLLVTGGSISGSGAVLFLSWGVFSAGTTITFHVQNRLRMSWLPQLKISFFFHTEEKNVLLVQGGRAMGCPYRSSFFSEGFENPSLTLDIDNLLKFVFGTLQTSGLIQNDWDFQSRIFKKITDYDPLDMTYFLRETGDYFISLKASR